MSRSNFYVDKADATSVEALIDAFSARGSEDEAAIRSALSLHEQSFLVYVDHVNAPPDLSPLDDPFTFNTETGELVLFSTQADVLVDAILEMAMYLKGFETLLSTGEEWKVQVAIGAWHHVRRYLREQLDLGAEATWCVDLAAGAMTRYNMQSFSSILFLAGRPNVEVVFPAGSNAELIVAYQRIGRIMEAVALEIDLDGWQIFNRRLRRALTHIERNIMPSPDISPFDELLGPDGWDDRFFEA